MRVAVQQEEGRAFVRFDNPRVTGTQYIGQRVALPAGATRIRVGVDLRVHELTPGDEDWKRPRITLDFLDAAGGRLASNGAVPQAEAVGGWQRFTAEREVPSGAVAVRLQPGLWFCAGRADFRAIAVEVLDGGAPSPAPARQIPAPRVIGWDEAATLLPAQVLAAWRDSAAVDEGSARSQIDLNGFWAFAPAGAADAAAPAAIDGYGLLLVPGSWSAPDVWSWKPPQGWRRNLGNPFTMRPGVGAAWKDFDCFAATRGWYARLIDIPAQWQGGRIHLVLDRVSTQAAVYVNGQPVGSGLAWPGGQVEIGPLLRIGASNCLQVLVLASDETRRELNLMGTGAGNEVEVKVRNRGLIGSVRLQHEPTQALLAAGLRIEPQVRQRRLDLRIPLVPALAGKALRLDLHLRPVDGQQDDVRQSLAVQAPADGTPLRLELPCPQVRLWTPERPVLYHLDLVVRDDAGRVDSLSRRFGFRQFEIQGRQFLLNGEVYRLRPTSSQVVPMGGLTLGSGIPVTRDLVRRHLRTMRELGFNLQEYWPGDPLARGTAKHLGPWCEVADEEGFLLTGPMPHLRNYLPEWRSDRPEGWEWPGWAVDLGVLRLIHDGEGRRVVVRAQSHEAVVSFSRETPVPPSVHRLTVEARMRATFAEKGREAWNGARVEIAALDAAGKPLPALREALHVGDSSGWVERRVSVELPAGAARLRLSAGVWKAIGEAEFADLRLLTEDGKELPINGAFVGVDPGAVRTRLLADAASLMEPLAHHPSLVMWGTSGNLFGSSLSPWAIGNRQVGLEHHPSWARSRLQPGMAAIEALSEVDRSRPVFAHSGGGVGAVYTANFYPGWTPLQDKTEWLTQHQATGDMPYWIVEYGNPINLSWRRDRDGHTRADTSEPWYTEFAAMELGPEAWEAEDADYRAALAATYRGTVNNEPRRWRFREPRFEELPTFQRIVQQHYREVWRSWRAQGAAALPIPWALGHAFGLPLFDPGVDIAAAIKQAPALLNLDQATLEPYSAALGVRRLPLADTLHEVAAPTIAYLAGANVLPDPGRLSGKEVLTSRTGNYRAGAPFQRTAVLINDSLHPVDYALALTMTGGGRTVHRLELRGSLQPGAIERRAVDLPAPAVADGEMLAAELRLNGKLDGRGIDDRVAVRFFGAVAGGRGDLVLHDPAGESGDLLRGLGYQVVLWQKERRPEVLVIGRRALSAQPGLLAELETTLRAGTRVLLLEQDPEALREVMGLRVARRIARQVWPVRSNAALLGDLDPAALVNWAGESRLLDPYPRWYDNQSNEVKLNGWRWGGRGGVSSGAVEKPHLSAWRPILQTEFDLAYSPLMELPVGRGRLMLSTLDLHDHVQQDPAAASLLHRLIGALRRPLADEVAERPARALVDQVWSQHLAELGIVFKEGLDGMPADAAVLIGRALVPAEVQQVERHVEAGGVALVLAAVPVPEAWGTQWRTVEVMPGGREPPRLAALRGLDVGDLRWRAAHPGRILVGAPAIDAGGQYAELPRGAGRVAFLGFDPWQFDTNAHPYMRFTAWRQARALTQVLANHGLRTQHDARLFVAPPSSRHLSLAGAWQAYPTSLVPGGTKPISDPGISAAATAVIAGQPGPTRSQELALPGPWEEFGGAWRDMDGEGVFQRTLEIPEAWRNRPLLLSLGVLDDFDTVFVDGVKVGATAGDTPRWWTVPRHYEIPGTLTAMPTIRITVRIWDNFGGGGFMSRDQQDLFVLPVDDWRVVQARKGQAGLYHRDYIDDFASGDDPYRYYNW